MADRGPRSWAAGMAEIRSCTNSDREAVVALALRAWEPVHASMRRVLGEMLYRRMIPDWRESQRATVTGELDSESSHVWVAVRQDTVVGFVAVHLEPDDRIGEVYLVAVDPDHQGRGVGRALIDHTTAWIGEQGMTTAMVETGGDEGHSPARALYENAGYNRPSRGALLPCALTRARAGTVLPARRTQAALCTTLPSSTVSHAFTSRNRSGPSVRTSASSTTRSAR